MTIQSFKKFSSARKAVAGTQAPIVRIGTAKGQLHLTGLDLSGLDTIELLGPDGVITATLTLRHLDRLGNANHAAADPKWQIPSTAFPASPPAREPSLVVIAQNWRDYDLPAK